MDGLASAAAYKLAKTVLMTPLYANDAGEHRRDIAREQPEGDQGRTHNGQPGSACWQCCSPEGKP